MQDEAALELPGTLRLDGHVVDEQGQPVDGATVLLDYEKRAHSDPDGQFGFADLPAGMVRLVAYKDELCVGVALVTVYAGKPVAPPVWTSVAAHQRALVRMVMPEEP